MATNVTKPETASRPMTEEADFLQIKSIDHVHFYVGNAKHAMYYWWKAFGFKPVAYSGLETGNRAFASYVLESGQARFVISASYSPTHEIAAHHLVIEIDPVIHLSKGHIANHVIDCSESCRLGFIVDRFVGGSKNSFVIGAVHKDV